MFIVNIRGGLVINKENKTITIWIILLVKIYLHLVLVNNTFEVLEITIIVVIFSIREA